MRNALYLIQKNKERRSKTAETLMTRSNLYKSSLIWRRKSEQAGNENIVENLFGASDKPMQVLFLRGGWMQERWVNWWKKDQHCEKSE